MLFTIFHIFVLFLLWTVWLLTHYGNKQELKCTELLPLLLLLLLLLQLLMSLLLFISSFVNNLLSTDSVYVKLVGYNIEILHCHHIHNC